MRTIETVADVAKDGKIILQLPPEVSPGTHKVVLVIDEAPVSKKEREPLNFPVDHDGSWPGDLSLKREDMYGDEGR